MNAMEYGISDDDIQQGKAMATVTYFGLPGFLVAYLTSKENRYVLYHAQQSLVIMLAWMLSGFLWILCFIPVIGLIFMVIYTLFIGIPLLTLFIIGLVNASGGQLKPLPVVGKLGLKVGMV
ncbi:MAG: DUF4870 domain-containing protein, partial [Candidatus Fermentibacteraceae bacterium]